MIFVFSSSEISRRCHESELDIVLLKHKISKKTYNRVNNNTLFKFPMETVVLDKQVISIESKSDILRKFCTIDHLLFFVSFILFMVHVVSALINLDDCHYGSRYGSLTLQMSLGLSMLFIQRMALMCR